MPWLVPYPGRVLGACMLACLLTACAHGDPSASLGALELAIAPELLPARDAYQLGKWQQTLDEITKLPPAATEETQLATHVLRAESLAQLGKYEAARNALRKAKSLKPKSRQAAHLDFRLGELALFAGDYPSAAKRLQAFDEQYPQHASRALSLPYLARVWQATGDPTAARQGFMRAVREFPAGPLADDSRLRLALLDYDAGDYAAAGKALRKLVDSSATEPVTLDSLYWLAMTHLHRTAYDEATAAFAELLKLSPHHRYAPAARYFTAETLRKAGKWQTAFSAYTNIIERADDQYRPYAELGALQCRHQLEPEASPALLDDAIALQQRLVQSGPQPLAEETVRLVAQALLDRGEFAKALHVIHRQLDASQHDARPSAARYRTLLLAAIAYRGLHQPGRADELLGRIRLDHCSESLREAVILARVRTQVDLEDHPAATQTIDEALPTLKTPSVRDALRAEQIRLLIAADQLPAAKRQFRALQQRETTQSALAHAARLLAEATYNAGEYLDARRLYETLRKWNRDPDDSAQALLGLAWVATKESQHPAAVQHFQEFLTTFPEHPQQGEARLMLARSLKATGNRTAAQQTLTWFEQQDTAGPLSAEALYQQALLASEDPGQTARAESLAQQLVRKYPHDDRADAAQYLLGTLQLTTDREQAQATFSALCENYPDSPYISDALYRLAEIRAETEPNSAGRLLTKLVARHPHPRVLPHALYLQSRLASSRKDWETARTSLVRLLKEYPDSPLINLARYGVAECYYQQQQYERAEKLFSLLTDSRYAEESWASLVRLRLAQLAVRNQDFTAAIHLAEAIDADDSKFTAQAERNYVIGRARAGQGEFTQAREAYRRVFQNDPTHQQEISVIARWMTGESYFHQQQWARAAEAFERVTDIPQHPRWQALGLLQLGKCYAKQGHLKEAIRCWHDLQSEFPESPAARQAAGLQQSTQRLLTKETAP